MAPRRRERAARCLRCVPREGGLRGRILVAILVVVLIERSPVLDWDCDKDYDKEQRRLGNVHRERICDVVNFLEHLIEHFVGFELRPST